MNISKISRSLVVVIFIAFILCLNYLDISMIIQNSDKNVSTFSFLKIGYVIVTAILVFIYVYIKDKLYKHKVNRKIALSYRYVYIIIVVVAAKILLMNGMLDQLSKVSLIVCTLLGVATAITIKQIVFNISKSDILSVLAVTMYALLPNTVQDKNVYIHSVLIVLFVTLSILFMQKLIDELKQQGIRTKRYLVLALTAGIFSGASIVVGVNIYVYLILLISSFLITCNLDRTHISFSKKILNNAKATNREILYKIERINISKLFISIVIILVVTLLVMLVCNVSLRALDFTRLNTILLDRIGYMDQIKLNYVDFNLRHIIDNFKDFVLTSRIYYLATISYILFIEILTVVLRRRYDTKSTAIKLIFMLVAGIYSILNLNIYMYQPMLAVLLILIAIVNTSNLYLNREERIKLLKA